MRPYVITHNQISADGRLDWFPVDPGLYYSVAGELNVDGMMTGADTMLLGGASGELEKQAPGHKLPSHVKGLLAVTDSQGRIRNWRTVRNFPYWDDIVVLCSKRTPRESIELLRKYDIDYIQEGENKVDLVKVLEKLRSDYGIKRLRIDSGGKLNGALFRLGLVDEVVLIISPYLVGGHSSRSMYQADDLKGPEGVVPLKLVQSRRLRGGLELLRYEVVR